mmetsp:Transcript_12642/g.46202  ORF Transcript_12642/g.46202 Transcript_12642/m.46202 type:complete len:240 (-) Transcript_12642:193-912(-)
MVFETHEQHGVEGVHEREAQPEPRVARAAERFQLVPTPRVLAVPIPRVLERPLHCQRPRCIRATESSAVHFVVGVVDIRVRLHQLATGPSRGRGGSEACREPCGACVLRQNLHQRRLARLDVPACRQACQHYGHCERGRHPSEPSPPLQGQHHSAQRLHPLAPSPQWLFADPVLRGVAGVAVLEVQRRLADAYVNVSAGHAAPVAAASASLHGTIHSGNTAVATSMASLSTGLRRTVAP